MGSRRGCQKTLVHIAVGLIQLGTKTFFSVFIDFSNCLYLVKIEVI